MVQGSLVKLGVRDWLYLIVLVSSAAVANIAGLHKISVDLRKEMVDLDRRWQDRTISVQKEIRRDIAEVKSGIPPDWFRSMVEQQGVAVGKQNERINELDKQITRLLEIIGNLQQRLGDN